MSTLERLTELASQLAAFPASNHTFAGQINLATQKSIAKYAPPALSPTASISKGRLEGELGYRQQAERSYDLRC
jgi:hypothetical protein